MHPLAPDLSTLNDDEVQKKYYELQKRYYQAYRYGPQDLVPQIQLMMEHYQQEIQARNKKQLEELQKKTDNKGFKNIIDIQ